MKRNNVAKRFGIASLCLATALSAFSGIASQKNSVALADGEIAVTDFVHTTAETVAKTTETITSNPKTATGLRLSSKAAYEGTFKTVFTGNTKLDFKFPETYDANTGYYGNFKIRIADVDDDSKYFDIVYAIATKSSSVYTINYLEYTPAGGTEQTRSSHYQKNMFYSKKITNEATNSCMPYFLSFCTGNNRKFLDTGYINLVWTDNVLAVKASKLTGTQYTIAEFDGTETFKAVDGSLENTTFGLPTIEDFKDGYTVSFYSNFTKTGVEDHGTDVFFTTITTNDGATTYNFSGDTIAVDDGMTQFNDTFVSEAPETEAGKVFLGWKDANGLHPANTLLRKANCEPVTIGYDTIDGASVRIDTTGNTSGIRFMTTFDKDDYAAVEQYITEKGTLVAARTALDAEKDFTIANYQDVIDENGNVKKVVNTKGVFDYTAANGTTYKAYSMAIEFSGVEENKLANYYTTVYSARGYLVVTYADGSTATIYTDYDADKNSRSIAQTAYNIKDANTEYASYDDDQKAIVNTYAGYFNAN